MILYTVIFYVLAGITVLTTSLAITRPNVVHAVVYLIVSFLGTALLFYLLGAPFLAVLEVIIYAGAIMVLFLFIVMMIWMPAASRPRPLPRGQWLPAFILGAVIAIVAGVMVFAEPGLQGPLEMAMAGPLPFGRFLFQQYWFPVEIVSFLLLIALAGALYLGKGGEKSKGDETGRPL